MMRHCYFLMIGTLLVFSCSVMKENKTIGSIERNDPRLNDIISQNAVVEIIGDGYKWSEGPVWVESEKMLLFSDVPRNIIYKWTEKSGVEKYLEPSGYTGTEPSKSKEPGSNGLTLDLNGDLLLCQHGDRRVARMASAVGSPKPDFIAIADNYEGKRFNSPNDLTVRNNGDVFFTDPPYGLPEQENDPAREIPFQGVYKTAIDGSVSLIIDSLTRPNGIILTPDGKSLIVANSDPGNAAWYFIQLRDDDSMESARIFYDAAADAKNEKGLPDGLKIDKKNNIFATGPGGIWVFNLEGKVLGKIKLPVASANCALAADDKTLFITASNYLLRVKLRD